MFDSLLGLFVGLASWYGAETCGPRYGTIYCRTASGEVFNQNVYTAASPYRSEMGKFYRIQRGEFSVVVRINDVCPSCISLGRRFDLSRGSMSSIGGLGAGVVRIGYIETVNEQSDVASHSSTDNCLANRQFYIECRQPGSSVSDNSNNFVDLPDFNRPEGTSLIEEELNECLVGC